MIQFRHLSLAFALLAAPAVQASTIAIIDSGVDIEHPDLQGKIWINSKEKENSVDDDGNGYKDDIYGWNFFANSNELIDLSYASLYNSQIDDYFALQDKFLLGTATEADLEAIQAMGQDPEFVKTLTKYGTFVHGTHVAGIASHDNPNARIATIRLVPVENPLLSLKDDILRARAENRDLNFITKGIIKGGLYLLARAQGAAFGTVGTYAGSIKADVANASLGVGAMQARLIITPIVKLATGGAEPEAAVIDELVTYFLEQAVNAQKSLASNSPNTFFVFASGNEGSNNDIFPVSPANAGLANTISVGASIDYAGIAPFSNYGRSTVDVLAPGVGIISSVPANRQMALSGTSQAAPFVAAIAGSMKDINPRLTPAQLKEIVIGTVDVKDYLADKVKSSGIANRPRAEAAARLTLSGSSIAQAIQAARAEVGDQSTETSVVAPEAIEPIQVTAPIYEQPEG